MAENCWHVIGVLGHWCESVLIPNLKFTYHVPQHLANAFDTATLKYCSHIMLWTKGLKIPTLKS